MAILAGDVLLKLGLDTADLDKQMKGIGGTIQKHSKAIGLGMTALGTGITASLGFAVKGAVDFETGMREVNTMMGLSEDEFTKFSKDIQELSAEMGVDAVDSTKALYQAISAGVPAENAVDFLRLATKAAIGGVTDTETAVDGLTTIINAFKIPVADAERVADIMFTTVKGGKTTMEELSNSMFQVAPIAASAGVSFEEVAASIATLTKQGVPTEQATTQVRQAIVGLMKPSAEMTAAFEELGIKSGDALLAEEGLAGAMEILTEYAGGSNEMLGKMFGSVEGLSAVLGLSGDNAEMFAKDIAAMGDATGSSKAAFEEMEKSTARQMTKLKESMSSVGITIGNVLLPVLLSVAEKIGPIVQSITDWTSAHPDLTEAIVIAAAAIGGILLVLGPLLLLLPGIVTIAPFVAGAFTLMLGPVGLVILAIAALVTGGYFLWKNWDTIVEKAGELWIALKSIFTEGVNFLIGLIETYANTWIQGINLIVGALNMLKVSIPDWVPVIGGKGFSLNLPKVPTVTLPRLAEGGIIPEPTLLYSLKNLKPYALAGEAGPERVSPIARDGGYKTANISIYLDGRVLTQVLGKNLVDELRLTQGLRI